MATETKKETRQYLTFKLDEEFFTVNVHNVREILEYVKITRMPDAPPFMRGIINVRGNVIPVIDLRQKFGFGETECKASTRIIVLEIEREAGMLIIGALADSVKEVIELSVDQIEPPPDMGTRWKKDYIGGVGKYSEEFVMLLDLRKLFTNTELTLIDQDDAQGNEE